MRVLLFNIFCFLYFFAGLSFAVSPEDSPAPATAQLNSTANESVTVLPKGAAIPATDQLNSTTNGSLEKESGDYLAETENEYIKCTLDVTGIRAWFFKKYIEELYSFSVKASKEDLVSPARGGFAFDSFLPLAYDKKLEFPSVHPKGRVLWDKEKNCFIAGLDSSSGYLAPGLTIEMKWYLGSKYSGRLELTVSNTLDTPVSLTDKAGNELYLYSCPLFINDCTRSAVTAVNNGTENPEVEVLSPKSSVKSLKTADTYIGATNQYYAFALKETSNVGTYVYLRKSIVAGKCNGKPEQSLSTPVVGWKFLWPKLRGGEKLQANFNFYIGPKQENLLKEAGYSELFDTWNGWTGPIGKLMFMLLTFLYSHTGNYAYAIILLTLIVKILLHPVSRQQMISMHKMQAIQPQMQKLKDEIKDPQKQQAAMQKLFIENNVNPVAGCLPLFLQIPIFVALYTCLSSSIELKNVSFLWLKDLSAPDPTLVLPILFAVGSYYSMQANSSGSEQMPVMKYMPVMMFFFFRNLASGVLIYFVGQSLFSFIEQKYNKAMLADDPLVVQAIKVKESAEASSGDAKKKKCKKKKKK